MWGNISAKQKFFILPKNASQIYVLSILLTIMQGFLKKSKMSAYSIINGNCDK